MEILWGASFLAMLPACKFLSASQILQQESCMASSDQVVAKQRLLLRNSRDPKTI